MPKQRAQPRRRDRRRRAGESRETARAAAPAPPIPWGDRLASVAPLAGPLAIAGAAGVMLARTWGTWPDVLVDFGRELYLAWRLAEGETLYVDVAHFSGPLSPYLNALWFRLFGAGLRTLALANIVLTAGFVALLYGFLARLASRLAATAACLTFVALFACAQYTRIGNYNWVCPYSHELTHGAMLVVAALWCLDRYHRSGHAGWMAGLGLAMGLVVLTKAEVLLAGVSAAGAGVALTLLVERPTVGRTARLLAVTAGAAAAPLLVVAAAFATVMPIDEVLRWPLGHWRAVMHPEVSAAAFYREGMGVEDLAGNLGALGLAALGYGAVLSVAVAGAFAFRRVRASLPLVLVGACVATAALLGRMVTLDAWGHGAPRPLPLFMAFLAAGFVVEALRRRADPERAFRSVRAAAFAIFALVLLAKMVLHVRLFHYGFVLAMPATMVLVVAMVEWLPAAVGRRGGRTAVVQAVALGALVAAIGPQLAFMQRLTAAKVHRVGRGADAFWADDRAVATTALLDQIRARVGSTETLVVLPEGAIVNYLARRVNPTPYYLFDGTSRALWGDARIMEALETAEPDWVAFVDRGGSRPPFGGPSGADPRTWVAEHYRPVWQRGVPFGGSPGASVALFGRGG